MKIRAIAVDTGGTILDWHAGCTAALADAGHRRGLDRDWHALANDWRRRAMQGIVGQVQPAFHMDDVHRRTLDEALDDSGLLALDRADRDAICAAWHRLPAWPDSAPGLARLRRLAPVISFTMLPLALVIDVSRVNRLVWDGIVSCQMIGMYKPHRQAYETAARWAGVPPGETLMVACHNFDLNAAHAAGFRTAFVRRPDEWGPTGPPDPRPDMTCDVVVDDMLVLAEHLEGRADQADPGATA